MSDDVDAIVRGELFDSPTVEMNLFLQHFEAAAQQFAVELAAAIRVWRAYQDAVVPLEEKKPHLIWSAAYLLNGLNAALVSTRLFLQGYLPASGNQVRHGLESMAFGILLAFPATNAFRDFEAGRQREHKALRGPGYCITLSVGRLAGSLRHETGAAFAGVQ